MFQANEKITVRSTDSRRDGFVAHDGIFLGYGRDGKTIIYDWCGLGVERRLDQVTVSSRATPFNLH